MLVLNATYEPINVCTVRRAVVLLLKDKAEVIEHAEWELHSANSTMARPVVIRLVSYVRIPRDTHRRKITRRAVFARDDWTCQYCGSRSNLTVDHVVPALQGRPLQLGEHRRLLRAVQPPQGQRAAAAGGHAPPHAAADARTPTSSSRSPARRSRRPGGPTWPPERPPAVIFHIATRSACGRRARRPAAIARPATTPTASSISPILSRWPGSPTRASGAGATWCACVARGPARGAAAHEPGDPGSASCSRTSRSARGGRGGAA